MRIKSYFADSVQEAIEKARVWNWAPDAMLMNSKKTEPELRSLGAYEVVFGVPYGPAIEKKMNRLAASAPAASQGHPPAPGNDLARELADLRKQIETVKRTVGRRAPNNHGASIGCGFETEEIRARLLAADFSEDLAAELAESIECQPPGGARGSALVGEESRPSVEWINTAISAELARRLRIAPELGTGGSKKRVVLFAGPAGAGKTTSLIKLAIQYGMRARIPLQILSLDTLRVGGWEQLASYARIAGLAFDVIHTVPGLDQALAEYRSKQLILIDTPGFSPADTLDGSDLAVWLGREPSVDVQLVVPAVLRQKIIERTLERFAAFRPAKLLFTHLDEIESMGTVISIAIRADIPISYLSDGQQVPEDIHEASAARILESFGTARQPVTARAA